MSEFLYLDVELKLRDDSEAVITPAYFLGSIEQSLDSFFGEIGGQTDLEITNFDKNSKRAVLKLREKFLKKTKAALSLIGEYQNIPCHFVVRSVSKEEIKLA